MTYKLTVRQGPRVTREKFSDLNEAIAAMERRAKDIRAAGPLEARKVFREYEPSAQVAGRVEISTGGVLKSGRDAGIDVMGDGTLVPYRGGFRRSELDPGHDGPFEAVRRALA
ncbi:MAG: hypothetical protein M3355_06975 [Actinomycetota bacterium]|nr:hypothetical protein [Actinomycetota bacterium]